MPIQSSNEKNVSQHFLGEIREMYKQKVNSSNNTFTQQRASTAATASNIGSNREIVSYRQFMRRQRIDSDLNSSQNGVIEQNQQIFQNKRESISKLALIKKNGVIQRNLITSKNKEGLRSPKTTVNKSLDIKKPLTNSLSPWTQNENLNNLKSFEKIDIRLKRQESIIASSSITNVNLGSQLQVQKEDIKKMIHQTNQVVSSHSHNKYDFIIEAPKKVNVIRLKCTPFVQYTGKVYIKGQQPPLRIEHDEDEILNNYILMLSFDDHTFTSLTQTFKNQSKITQPFPTHFEHVFVRYTLESQDILPINLRFKILFGPPPKKRIPLLNTQTSTISSTLQQYDPQKPVSGYFNNNKLFKSKLNHILNDDFQQNEAIRNMQEIFRDKRQKLFQDKNFISSNVDKAQLWSEIQDLNLNLQQANSQIDHIYASKKRLLSQQHLRKHKIYDINRWEVFRQNKEEFNQRKLVILNQMVRGCGWLNILKLREIAKILKRNMIVRAKIRDFKIKTVCALNFVGNAQIQTQNNQAQEMMLGFLRQNQQIKVLFRKLKRFYNQMLNIQNIWNQQCELKRKRIKELTKLFDDEKDKLIMFILKTKQNSFNLIKKLKKLKDQARDAVIKRYMLKCYLLDQVYLKTNYIPILKASYHKCTQITYPYRGRGLFFRVKKILVRVAFL
eukprot:403332708